jgi:hypothetical protein
MRGFLAISSTPHPVLRTTLSPQLRGEGKRESCLFHLQTIER